MIKVLRNLSVLKHSSDDFLLHEVLSTHVFEINDNGRDGSRDKGVGEHTYKEIENADKSFYKASTTDITVSYGTYCGKSVIYSR